MPTLEELFAATSALTELRLELSPLTSTYARVCPLPLNTQWIQENDLRIGHLNPESPNPTTLKALTENHPAAIGYLLSKRSEAIPNELIKQAKALNIALFSIPPDMTSETLEKIAIGLSLDSKDSTTSIASYAQITQTLLKTLKSHKPERSLLDQLHSLTNGSFLLLASDNRTLAQSGPLRIPKDRLLDLNEGSYRLQIRDQQQTAYLFHISSDNFKHDVFVAVIQNPNQLGFIGNAAALLSIIQEKQFADIQLKSIQREAFLSEWFADSFDKLSFHHQLSSMGFDISASYAVAVVLLVNTTAKVTHSREDASQLLESVQLAALNFFDTISLTTLSSIRPKYQSFSEDSRYIPHCIFVFSGASATAQLKPLFQALTSAQKDDKSGYKLQLGISQESAIYSASELKKLYQQAQQAAQQAKQVPQQFYRPEPLHWLLSEQSDDKLQAITDALLEPIRNSDKSGKLFDTLLAYLDKPNNLDQLADSLDIHINTLRYRLKKIETLTGKSLNHPKSLAEFYMLAEIMKLSE